MSAGNYLSPSSSETEKYDAGLRSYLQKAYFYMAAALVVTGLIAFYSAQSDAFLNAMYVMQGHTVIALTPFAWAVMFAPLVMAFFLDFGLMRLSLPAMQMSFWIYAALIGLSLSVIFLGFTGESIARTFFVAAGTFAGAGLYGYTTKLSMTNMASFMMMGLIGLIVAMLVNMLLQSPGMQFAICIAGVIIFTGLTAYDTRHLKKMYDQFSASEERTGKMAVFGALTLYLDLINLFLSFLSLFGDRRRR